jgi:hypothetical protein
LTPSIHIIVVVVSPTTPPTAGIGRCDDRRQVADVDLAAKHRAGDRAADQRGGDVIQEARQHENHEKQHQPAFPVVGQQFWQPLRNAAGLEVLGQQRKAEQQAQQVGEQHPFLAEVIEPAGDAGSFRERRKRDLEQRYHDHAADGDRQRMVVKQRDSDQGQPEQQEIDRHTGNRRRLDRRSTCHGGQQQQDGYRQPAGG